MRTLIGLLLLCIAANVQGQIISTVPQYPTVDDTVTITYDATKGNQGLVGVAQVYAHTGIITDKSSSSTDCRYVQGTWGTADAKVKMTNIGNNKHQIKFHIRSFYGVPSGETGVRQPA